MDDSSYTKALDSLSFDDDNPRFYYYDSNQARRGTPFYNYIFILRLCLCSKDLHAYHVNPLEAGSLEWSSDADLKDSLPDVVCSISPIVFNRWKIYQSVFHLRSTTDRELEYVRRSQSEF